MRQFRGWLVLLLVLITSSAAFADQRVLGSVYEPDGSPAIDARVWACPVSLNPKPLVHGVTDEHGTFTFNLDDGRWWVLAAKGTMGGEATDTSRVIHVLPGMPVMPLNIQMIQRGLLAGKITAAATGEPIAEAKLYLDNGEVLTTDEHGQYDVGGLSLDAHSLYAVAKGYERTRVLFDLTRRPEATLNIELNPGGRLSGTVLDKDSNPIPGAYVRRSTSGNMLAQRGLVSMCDEQGRYEFDGLAFDVAHSISFWAPGYEQDETHNAIFISSQQPPKTLDIVLTRSQQAKPVAANQPPTNSSSAYDLRDLSGLVVDPNDQPCVDANVRWGATEYELINRSTQTNAEGRFTLEDVPNRAGYITVSSKFYAPRFVPVEPGSDPLPTIGLKPGTRVLGRIVNDAGEPVTDVCVIPLIASPDSSLCNPLWLNDRQTYSQEDGRFEISALPNGCLFDFLKSGMSDRRNYPLLTDGVENTVVMTSSGAVCGRVTDQDGQPVTQFRILLNSPDDIKPGERFGGFFAGFCWPGISFTDPDGQFLVSDLTVGNVQSVTIWSDDHQMTTINRVTAKPADQLGENDSVKIIVKPAPQFDVRVEDESGPIKNAIVYVIHNEPRRGQHFDWNWEMRTWKPALIQRTDEQGFAHWDTMPVNDANIAVDCEGYGRQRLHWQIGDKSPVVQLHPEAVVEGFAADSEGRALNEGYINLTNQHGDVFTVSLNPQEQGRFRIDRLPAGDYEFYIRYDQQILDRRSFTLEPGQTLFIGQKTADALR